jgi:hypothetical protein
MLPTKRLAISARQFLLSVRMCRRSFAGSSNIGRVAGLRRAVGFVAVDIGGPASAGANCGRDDVVFLSAGQSTFRTTELAFLHGEIALMSVVNGWRNKLLSPGGRSMRFASRPSVHRAGDEVSDDG